MDLDLKRLNVKKSNVRFRVHQLRLRQFEKHLLIWRVVGPRLFPPKVAEMPASVVSFWVILSRQWVPWEGERPPKEEGDNTTSLSLILNHKNKVQVRNLLKKKKSRFSICKERKYRRGEAWWFKVRIYDQHEQVPGSPTKTSRSKHVSVLLWTFPRTEIMISWNFSKIKTHKFKNNYAQSHFLSRTKVRLASIICHLQMAYICMQWPLLDLET